MHQFRVRRNDKENRPIKSLDILLSKMPKLRLDLSPSHPGHHS